jgi:hypothetical protein
MENSSGEAIIIQIDTVDQIFNAPALDPFSDREVDVLGEPALLRAVRGFLAKGAPPRRWARLVFKLPASQVSPDLQPRLLEAVTRYCTARIRDNQLKIRISRMQGLLGLALAVAIVIAIGAAGYLLLSAWLAEQSQTIQGLVVGFYSVFVWVILWDPMNRLLFDWVSPALENRILSRIMELDIEIQPQS